MQQINTAVKGAPSLTLVIMAAGLGSRFGGDKQLAPLGPHQEIMMALSIANAIKVGFSAAVVVTRPELVTSLRSQLQHLPTDFVIAFCEQGMLDLPQPCLSIVGQADYREKPWGTAHALWSARQLVDGPMAVINADDYYGIDAFQLLADGFRRDANQWQMVAYPLSETLSPYGGVNRGLCVTEGDYLVSVQEWLNIARQDTVLKGELDGQQTILAEDAMVSMTCWGFTPDIFSVLERALIEFVMVDGSLAKSECFLPAVVQAAIADTRCDDGNSETKVFVSKTQEPWLGVTYPQDSDWVKQKLMELVGD